MTDDFEIPFFKNSFRDEDSSNFCELIAVEHTVRTSCDPRGPRVAANSITQRFEFRVSAIPLCVVFYDYVEGSMELNWEETNPEDLFCYEDTAVGIATVEDRNDDQVIVPVVVEVHDR